MVVESITGCVVPHVDYTRSNSGKVYSTMCAPFCIVGCSGELTSSEVAHGYPVVASDGQEGVHVHLKNDKIKHETYIPVC